MRIALIGLPGCGRTTLFRALASNPAADPSKPLTVQVPDGRLDVLAAIWNPRKVVKATVIFTDTQSPAFSPRAFGELRDATALALVLDDFARGSIENDFRSCEAELILSDLSVVEKRMERLIKESRARTQEYRVLETVKASLETERPLRTAGLDREEQELLSPYALLSLKPLFAVSNRSEQPVSNEQELKSICEASGAGYLAVNAAFELELVDLPEEERPEFLRSQGYEASSLTGLVSMAYFSLDLISFLTMGADEVRAWPVRAGSSAVEAAACIHTDMARGFIRAQVIAYEDYCSTPDMARLRERGAVRLEGRDYVVKDGDIIEFRFSV
jgi:ribosome-binding ATPase YchF (GTP1/OBG family)